MDRDTPESLIQFLDNATTSVRAALERPREIKSTSQANLLQKLMFVNQSPTRERRRFKGHSRRRRRNPLHHQSSMPELWKGNHRSQPRDLNDILGMADTCQQVKESQPAPWRDQLHWSENRNRDFNDDTARSPGFASEWQQTQSNTEYSQGAKETMSGMYADSDIYSAQSHYGNMKQEHHLEHKSQYTLDFNSPSRTLDEVVNMMPVGCHLPPPLPGNFGFQGKLQPQAVDAVSKKIMPMILGITERESFSAPTDALPPEKLLSSSSLTAQTQYTSECTTSDMDLLSQLVTELDKNNTLDKLTRFSSSIEPTYKEMTVNNFGSSGRHGTGTGQTHDENRQAQTGYEGIKSIPEWGKYTTEDKRQKFISKSLSIELACALQDTHIGSGESPTEHRQNAAGPQATKQLPNLESTRKVKPLQRSASLANPGIACGNGRKGINTEVPRHYKQSLKIDRQHLLVAMRERKSMPNLYSSAPQHNLTSQYPTESTASIQESRSKVKIWKQSNGDMSEGHRVLQCTEQQTGNPGDSYDGNRVHVDENSYQLQQWSPGTLSVNTDVAKDHVESADVLQHGREWSHMDSCRYYSQARVQAYQCQEQGNARDQEKSSGIFDEFEQWAEVNLSVHTPEFYKTQSEQGNQWNQVDSFSSSQFNNALQQSGTDWTQLTPSATPKDQYSYNPSTRDNSGFSVTWTSNAVGGAVKNICSADSNVQWARYKTDNNSHMNSEFLADYNRTDILFNSPMSNDGSTWPSEGEEEDAEEEEEEDEDEEVVTEVPMMVANPHVDAPVKIDETTSPTPLPSFSSTFLNKGN